MKKRIQPKTIKLIALTVVFALLQFFTNAQVSYTGGTYSQNFDGLPSSGTYTLTGIGPHNVSAAPINATGATGWQLAKFLPVSGNALFNVGSGTSGTGSAYSFGLSSERAFGSVASGTTAPAIGCIIQNNSGSTLTEFTITFTGEQWRNGGSNNLNTLFFGYAVGGTNILTGTFTSVSALNFSSPVSSVTAAALNGNVAPNRTVAITSTITGLTWANGQNLVIRWNDADNTGGDDGLGIDEFSFSTPSAPTTQDNTINFPTVLPTSITANWINGDGASRIVVVNTSNSFTNPTNNVSSPSANNVYGGSGEQVVYNGTGTTVSVTGLTASTNYWFRVYAYNGAGATTLYNFTTNLTNPNNQTTLAAASPLITVTGSLTNFGNILVGNSSLEQSYLVKGDNLTTDIVINAPAGFEISTTSGSGFTNSIALSPVLGSVPDSTIFVRFTPTGLGVASGNITHTSTLATTVNQAVAGTGVEPVLTASAINFNFGSVLTGTNSPNQTYTIKGDNLKSNISINTTADFEISTSPGSGFGSSLTLIATGLGNPEGGFVATTTIYVRFSPIVIGAQSSSITNVSTDALTKTITLSGNALAAGVFTELVVPQYMGSKSTASGNNCRTPIAVCVNVDNLLPFTAYDVKVALGLTSDAANSFGAGSWWNGTAYGTANIVGAFFTDAIGSSGPVWYYIQPSANGTRFDAGQVHNLRMGYAVTGNSIPSIPLIVGLKTITALDIPTTARTAGVTSDDGAFLKVTGSSCVDGKFILVYNNTAGTGDPLFSYQARNASATNTTQSDLPTAINEIFAQSGASVSGDYAAVIPIGANNTNGVRRIEARNADNTVYRFTTDADGIWPSGANTTNNTRRSITSITATDGLNNVNGSISGDNIICSGNNSVLNFSFTGTPPFAYIYTDGTNNFGPYFAVTNSDSKTVTPTTSTLYSLLSVDDAQCTGATSGTAFVFVNTGPPATSVVLPINNLPATACNGTTVSISVPFVTGASEYVWDAPAGCYFNSNPINVSPFTTSVPNVSLTFGSAPGSASGYYIGVQAGNICGPSFRKAQWVRGILSSPTVTGPTVICAGGSGVYSITNPAAMVGAQNYTWTGPAGSTIDGNPSPYTTTSTAAVTLVVPIGFTSGTMCVVANAGCISTPPKCISISISPAVLGQLSGNFTVCPPATEVYTVSNPGVVGGTYNWTLPANTTGSATTLTNSNTLNILAGYTGGDLKVTYTNTCGVTSTLRSKSIGIGLPTVPASITAPNTTGLCAQLSSFGCPPQSGATFNWTFPTGSTPASITAGGNNVLSTMPGAGFVSGSVCVTATNGCGTSTARCITVKGTPLTPGVITIASGTLCAPSAGPVGFTSTVSGLTGLLNWTVLPATAATTFSGQGTNTYSADWNTAGAATVNLTASNACGSTTRTLAVNVSGCVRLAGEATATIAAPTVNVYPNPASNLINIEYTAKSNGNVVYKLVDLTGKAVAQKEMFATEGLNSTNLDLSNLSKGIYMLNVLSSETNSQIRVVVQ